MAKRTVSQDDFRGLFALYALTARHNHNQKGADRLMRLFTSSGDIADDLLDLWSERADKLGPETVGAMLCPRARAVANGVMDYDHASDFLHALLRDLDQKEH